MENQSAGTKDRSMRYFTIGACFLFAMALFWSVDASLIYIFLGIASYFFFLGFYKKPRKAGSRPEGNRFQQGQKTSSSTPHVSEAFKNIFTSKKATYTQAGSSPDAVQKRKTAIKIFLAIFAAMFLLPIFFSLFNSGDGATDSGSYFMLAETQYNAQQYDSAYLNYRQAMRLDPERKDAILGYGRTLVVRNEGDSAVMMFNRALEIDPDYMEASYEKGLVYYNQKKYKDGIELMKPVLENNPNYYQGMLLMGDYYYVENKYDEAMVWYEKAYNEGGMRSSTLCHIMAYYYDTKNDTERAIAFYKEALSYDDSIVTIYERLGELIQGDEGNSYRTKAAELRPK